jgi:hypothetical protein
MATTDPDGTKREDVSTERGATGTFPDMVLGVQLQAHLGRNLRAAYQALAGEAVPERLRKLLDQLEQQEKTVS